ncbi:MAG: leucine--tRNA ligase [Patescibacteria group bacterium]
MSSTYDHKQIEPKWQKHWEEQGIFHAADVVRGKKNFYLLVEFPYPSGNLHIGHWYAFAIPDIFARFMRMRGFNVLFPIGFDAFGLPAENAALKRGINPRTWTHDNIEYMRKQLRRMGASFDWEREVVTCEPDYYRWTQWIFLQFFKAGLAYQADSLVNWCHSCKTVLANEQVIDGRCERCESAVMQRKMKQWLLKIKDFADALLHDLETLPWPEEIKEAQRNWIGRSEGALVKFPISNFQFPNKSQITNSNLYVEVFTTRPDTIFGATYLVLAPEHPLIENLESGIKNLEEVKEYIERAKTKTEMERGQLQKEKTGVELAGIRAVNPATKEEIPIWVADYVLMGYGTGAIMAVPGHDARDFAFAQEFHLPIRKVISPEVGANGRSPVQGAYEGEGAVVNSGKFTGLDSQTARERIVAWLELNKLGKRSTSYKLRDWLISRQRYWGCPIPIIYCRRCWENPKSKIQNPKLVGSEIDGVMHAVIPVPGDQLPVELPELDDYKPRDDGRSPLSKAADWVRVKCPQCGGAAERETDTLDTFIDSSWYFLRYTDPGNEKVFAAQEKMAQWMPVNLYSGGAEHTTMHLLYSRFWIKAMERLKLVPWCEPYVRRLNRGIILGPDGQKMSKSHGNVVDPDEQVERLGADAVRMYLAFIGPYATVGAYPWSMNSIVGVRRFLERVWMLGNKLKTQNSKLKTKETFINKYPAVQKKRLQMLAHQTIKKVTEDIESFKFNTAIAQLMTYTNELVKADLRDPAMRDYYTLLIVLLAPFAPHIAEELWQRMRFAHAADQRRSNTQINADDSENVSSIFKEPWPKFDPRLILEMKVSVVIQINGKKRGMVEVLRGAGEEEVFAAVGAAPEIQKYLRGITVTKKVYVKGKLLNIVAQ